MAALENPLDHASLELLAKYIGEKYSGSELAPFFRRAGIPVPEHDSSTKWRWALEQLQNLNEQPKLIGQVILRLASPHEYAGNPQDIQSAHEALNQLLALEGIELVLDGVTPVLRSTTPGLRNHVQAQRPEFVPSDPPEFSSFVSDTALQAILAQRWSEAQRCVEHGSYLSAIVMMGSILEASLLSVAMDNRKAFNTVKATPKDRNGSPLPLTQWHLSQLIEVANQTRWIHPDVKDFGTVLRDYRNMVHPWQQRKVDFSPDKDTCAVCWEVVKATMNDLIDAKKRQMSTTK